MALAMLLMALNDDPESNFSVNEPVARYLPWEGVYGDRTVTQLLSNTSGIPGLGSVAPGTRFDYGGSQWQLAGAVAAQVSNSTWRQAFDAYVAEPCDLEVFQFGNMWSNLETWTGSPDSLQGLDNPNIEGGAISSLQDYAKILLMHLNGGLCGDNSVMSEDSVAFMQVDRGGEFGVPNGMGWWHRRWTRRAPPSTDRLAVALDAIGGSA
tara:strand:- start:43606 stop:44232 length:627 start_codon:yes stop_codon:yes gene_type:complete